MKELKTIIEELEALSLMPLLTKPDLAAWNTRAGKLLEKLHTGSQSVYDALPHFIEHYLADADIRLKDGRYRDQQQEQIKKVIGELKSKANKTFVAIGAAAPQPL